MWYSAILQDGKTRKPRSSMSSVNYIDFYSIWIRLTINVLIETNIMISRCNIHFKSLWIDNLLMWDPRHFKQPCIFMRHESFLTGSCSGEWTFEDIMIRLVQGQNSQKSHESFKLVSLRMNVKLKLCIMDTICCLHLFYKLVHLHVNI